MKKYLLITSLLLFAGNYLPAQMIIPEASPKASVTQRVGITDVTVVFHRPAVKDRDIWGTRLAPYDGQPFPWRAGANDNTTVETTHDLLVEGSKLPAGTYGLHMIPKAQGKWTVIFSKNATSWGSFRYNPAEDALRVEVEPADIPHQEFLLYQFTDLTPSGGTLALDWEKKRIPISYEVANMHDVVIAHFGDMLRGRDGFTWRGWFEAGKYCDLNDTHLAEGLQAANMSIARYPKWDNYSLKENLLRKLGREEEADQVLHDKIHNIASGNALNSYGYQLLGQKKYEEALDIFTLNVEKHPDDPNFYDSLGECYKEMGDTKKAIAQYKKALSMDPPANVKDNALKMLAELDVDYKE